MQQHDVPAEEVRDIEARVLRRYDQVEESLDLLDQQRKNMLPAKYLIPVLVKYEIPNHAVEIPTSISFERAWVQIKASLGWP